MAYFHDLSDYVYQARRRVLNVGWLDAAHAFPTEVPPPEVLERLWRFCGVLVNPTRGLHLCELCSEPSRTFVRGDTRLVLGSGEICVFSPDGDVFAAPNLLYHYVDAHHYRPPAAFLGAVLDGPCPPSVAYVRMLEGAGFTWRDNVDVAGEPIPFRFVRTKEGVVKVEGDVKKPR